ncbi:hypothetical protein HanIR_Chr15g0748011 [Helianthus annuus]|nr:hypothetical protein HanIR_Chr15g0748011 [Helianthus annuus]
MNRCFATVCWSVGISSGVEAMLKPVPIGLSRNKRPKIRFHEPGLGSSTSCSTLCVSEGVTRNGPSS